MTKSQKDGIQSRLVLDKESNEIILAFGYVYKVNKEDAIEMLVKKYPKFDPKVKMALGLREGEKKWRKKKLSLKD